MEYVIGSNTFTSPVIVRYRTDDILTQASPRRSDELAVLQCYVWHDGKLMAVVRQDRIFPQADAVDGRYQIVREQRRQAVIDKANDTKIVELIRRADRPTLDVSLHLQLPDKRTVVASPDAITILPQQIVLAGNYFGGNSEVALMFS